MLPAIFIIWSLAGLHERYGLDVGALALWLAALAIGAAIGAAILQGRGAERRSDARRHLSAR
jgi:hypothetical protein